jgi:diguanylate cyclase (GGDEF)-like protein
VKHSSDLPARYGGEEFAVILPDTESNGAFCLAESIRKEVENLRIFHDRSFISPYITISMGVASLVPSRKLSSEMLVEFADKALYEAKNKGRNRTVLKMP